MFVCPSISELRFNECCHPCFKYYPSYLFFQLWKARVSQSGASTLSWQRRNWNWTSGLIDPATPVPIRPRRDRGTRARTNLGQTLVGRVTLALVNLAIGRATQAQTSPRVRANLYHPAARPAAAVIMSAAPAVAASPRRREKSARQRRSVRSVILEIRAETRLPRANHVKWRRMAVAGQDHGPAPELVTASR